MSYRNGSEATSLLHSIACQGASTLDGVDQIAAHFTEPTCRNSRDQRSADPMLKAGISGHLIKSSKMSLSSFCGSMRETK